MDLNRLIQMIINTLLRRAVNGAVNKGINMACLLYTSRCV